MEKNCIKYSLFAICVSAFLCMGTAFAASDYHYDTTVNKNYNSQRGKIVYVPQGTTCSAMLLQDINSKTCSKGMNIYATLDKDFLYGIIHNDYFEENFFYYSKDDDISDLLKDLCDAKSNYDY